MKNTFFVCLALGLAGLTGPVFAGDVPAARPAPDAVAPDRPRGNREMSREETEMHRRRYEIMVLVQAYRILPDEQKPALREEIVKRLRADYEANRARMEKTLAQMEENLNRLKSKLDERTSDEVVETEFKRLLEMPIGGIGPMGWMGPLPGNQPRKGGDFRPGIGGGPRGGQDGPQGFSPRGDQDGRQGFSPRGDQDGRQGFGPRGGQDGDNTGAITPPEGFPPPPEMGLPADGNGPDGDGVSPFPGPGQHHPEAAEEAPQPAATNGPALPPQP